MDIKELQFCINDATAWCFNTNPILWISVRKWIKTLISPNKLQGHKTDHSLQLTAGMMSFKWVTYTLMLVVALSKKGIKKSVVKLELVGLLSVKYHLHTVIGCDSEGGFHHAGQTHQQDSKHLLLLLHLHCNTHCHVEAV